MDWGGAGGCLTTPLRELLVSAVLYFECFLKISSEERAPPWRG